MQASIGTFDRIFFSSNDRRKYITESNPYPREQCEKEKEKRNK